MRYIDIPDSTYAVSETGRILNKRTKRFMTPQKDSNRYKIVLLIKDKPVCFRIHWLVAMAFVPNPNNYSQIGFKDNDPSNLNVKNLYWFEPEAGIKEFTERVIDFGPVYTEVPQEIPEPPKLKDLTGLDSVALALRNKEKDFAPETLSEMKAELKRGGTLREVAFDYGLTVTIVKRLLA